MNIMCSLTVRIPGGRYDDQRKIGSPKSNSRADLTVWLRQEGLLFRFNRIDFSEATPEIIDTFHESFFHEYADKDQLRDILHVYEQHESGLSSVQRRRFQFVKDIANTSHSVFRDAMSLHLSDASTVGATSDQEDSANFVSRQPSSQSIRIPGSPLRLPRELYKSFEDSEQTDSA